MQKLPHQDANKMTNEFFVGCIFYIFVSLSGLPYKTNVWQSCEYKFILCNCSCHFLLTTCKILLFRLAYFISPPAHTSLSVERMAQALLLLRPSKSHPQTWSIFGLKITEMFICVRWNTALPQGKGEKLTWRTFTEIKSLGSICKKANSPCKYNKNRRRLKMCFYYS